MKVLVAGFTVAAVLGGPSGANAQSNSNLPFLRPQNGAQVQIPSGWPPGSGDVQARPPTSYSAPGGYAPFQGASRGDRGAVDSGDRGNDRGVVGEPEPGMDQPRADTPDPLVGTPNRAYMRKPMPGSGDDKAGSGQQAGSDQGAPSQNNMAHPRNLPQEAEVVPKVIRLPSDPRQRAEAVFDLFRKSREVKPPARADVRVAVGSRLPASWIYMDVPETVSRALPGYLGYVYTSVDGRYVVLDPATYKVVAIYAKAGRDT